MKRQVFHGLPLFALSFFLICPLCLAGGCGQRMATPQSAQEAKARFTAHPQTKDLSPKAQEMVNAMKNRASSTPK